MLDNYRHRYFNPLFPRWILCFANLTTPFSLQLQALRDGEGGDRTVNHEFQEATVSFDSGLFQFRDLDDAVRLTETAAVELLGFRTRRNVQHGMIALLRQSVYRRRAGIERCE